MYADASYGKSVALCRAGETAEMVGQMQEVLRAAGPQGLLDSVPPTLAAHGPPGLMFAAFVHAATTGERLHYCEVRAGGATAAGGETVHAGALMAAAVRAHALSPPSSHCPQSIAVHACPCGKSSEAVALHACGGCRAARYCSKRCQASLLELAAAHA